MNIRIMRFVDRFLGIPLCWMLALLLLLVQPDKKKRAERSGMPDILVIKFFGFGSIVLTTPALSVIKTVFPQCRLTFLSFHENKELLDRLTMIDKVITIRRSSFGAFVWDTAATAFRIFQHRYDIVFDLEFFSKYSTLMSGLSRAPVRAAFALPAQWRSRIVTHPVQLRKEIHVICSFCEQVFAGSNSRVNIPPLQAPTISAFDHLSLLQKVPAASKRLVTVNINAGETFLERRWPPERFAELVSKVGARDECLFCFIGNALEQAYVQRTILMTDCPECCVNASGLLSIPELGALLQRSEILISNDSGPLHFAAALGIPTIGLYGPESPDFYGQKGPGSRSLYKRIACSPCMNVYSAKDFRCPYDAQCMKEISVEEVADLVRTMSLAA